MKLDPDGTSKIERCGLVQDGGGSRVWNDLGKHIVEKSPFGQGQTAGFFVDIRLCHGKKDCGKKEGLVKADKWLP